MKFFSAIGGKKDRSTRSAARSKSNGRSVVQPEIRNIISNKRTERAISHGKDNNNGCPVNKNRSVSNSVSAGSWVNQEVDETAVAQSRNQRFPLSTTSDPWSQATWPEEDDGFFFKPRNQAINSTEWVVPADLTDHWQGRFTDSWDGVGSREHPIAVEEDPLRTRESDILARQQRQHGQRSSGFEQQVASRSTFETAVTHHSISMSHSAQHRLYSSDTVVSEEYDVFPQASGFLLKRPTSPAIQTEVSGLTNPSFFQNKKIITLAPRTVDPFNISPFAADRFDTSSDPETMEIFADPFAEHFHNHIIVSEGHLADDPALDCVDVTSDEDDDGVRRQEVVKQEMVRHRRQSRAEPKPESHRTRSPSPSAFHSKRVADTSPARRRKSDSPLRNSSFTMVGTSRNSNAHRFSPRSSPVPTSPLIKSRATPASPIVPKPPEPRLDRFRGQDHGKIMAARRGLFNQRNVPSRTSEAMEPPLVKKSIHHRSEPSGILAASLLESDSVTKQRYAPERLSSVGSDIRRLRSTLRRNGRTSLESAVRGHSTAISFDENDPMQRAGLRLLSAAVIPVQCMVRKHLALREALTRMWAIVMIQACARRWFVQSNMKIKHDAASRIQALYRAGVQRDHLLLQQCCAIEIQRHVRGLLATLDVYEKIYNITLIQTAVRKFLAMNQAMDRMVSIIQIQSVVRTFLVRKELAGKRAAATKIQTSYRSFIGRFNYQLDLLDIIIIQSVWRRRKAQKLANAKRSEREYKAAVAIQTQWRSYDCTMNYLHFLADVLIAQSAVRRWKARRVANTLRHRHAITLQAGVRMWFCKTKLRRLQSAVMIQKVWRGFVAYADYMFAIADVVIIQSVARRWLAIRRRRVMQEQQRQDAGVTIQRYWRRFVAETEYLIMKYEHRAATLVQAQWRRFWHFSNFIISLDSAMTIQSTFRGYQAKQRYGSILSGVVAIQHAVRAFQLRQAQRVSRSAKEILYPRVDENRAACVIQTRWRGATVRRLCVDYLACRLIQAQFRGHVIRTAYKKGREAFLTYLAARKIQTFWRRHLAKQRLDLESLAASKIQAVLRGNGERASHSSDNILTAVSPLGEGQVANSTAIQKTWRAYLVRKAYGQFTAARLIQASWRAYVVRIAYKEYLAASKIQAVVRGYLIRFCFWKRAAARIIQRYARAYLCTKPFHKYAAARTIQRSWRGYSVRSTYRDQIVGSARRNLACIKIQRQSRRFFTEMKYLEVIGSVIVVQTVARKYLALKEYENRRVLKRILEQARSIIAGDNPDFEVLVRQQERENAARKIQRFFLWVKAEVDREIRHQKKRLQRKLKRRQKRCKRDDEEDALLENVFSNVAASPSNKNRPPGQSTPHDFVKATNDPHMIAVPEEYRGVAFMRQGQLTKHRGTKSKQSRHEDGETVSSEVSSTYYYKMPPPRVHRLKRSELDEDFCLEEAWIDTEIQNARERRQADRAQRKSSKPSKTSRRR
ncbi:hypothetical protein FisN_3Lh009 [Fistulifera solaris]|uniref:Uncharacterized protein n=1 Tax=Fistulifera solaris TaxID=1519565 RepID=A0A1Z5JYG1_FISSO|nr:hypothetical protein FisN_3Lh009 [Fistulifera solaris]|eukprot:GAX19075.1 hypothetical protein FisN_3Lh009 [Fistulifera solaris]